METSFPFTELILFIGAGGGGDCIGGGGGTIAGGGAGACIRGFGGISPFCSAAPAVGAAGAEVFTGAKVCRGAIPPFLLPCPRSPGAGVVGTCNEGVGEAGEPGNAAVFSLIDLPASFHFPPQFQLTV
jgi:hypothetical protein